jgi:hypothetical protein
MLQFGAGVDVPISGPWGIQFGAFYHQGIAWKGFPDMSDYRYGLTVFALTYSF